MKAMILAAGRGTRMGELTKETPKALLKVNNEALIERRIRRLSEYGIKEFVINVYGVAKMIPKVLGDGSKLGVSIQYSVEEEILETAGGIIQALPLLGEQPFLVCSCDTVTDFDFSRLIDHQLGTNHAHLVLTQNPEHHQQGDYVLHETGLINTTGSPKLTYAGFGLLDPKLFSNTEPGFRKIAVVFEQAMAENLVSGEIFDGLWLNVDTPERLQYADKLLAK